MDVRHFLPGKEGIGILTTKENSAASGIKKGTRIDISDEDGRIVLRPITRDFIDSLYGRFKGSKLVEALEADRARENAREEAKIARFR